MADATIFQITSGTIAFQLVDPSAVGYLSTWLAPGGKTADTVAASDYNVSSGLWTCQATSGALTASQDTTTTDVPATFCGPARSIPQPAQTSFTLDLSFLQDPNVKLGFSRYLYENDTLEAFVFFGMNTWEPPKMVGRCRLIAGTIGGAARSVLTADVSLPMSSKPQISFGTTADHGLIPPTFATGATAGVPGTWTPAGSSPPANAADATAKAIVASPATAWTTGQYVAGTTAGTPGEMNWSGTAWVAGRHA